MQHQNFEIKHLSIFQRAIYDKAREAYLFYHLYVSSFVYLLVKRHNCLQRFEMQKLCTQQISCYIVNVGNRIETKTIPSRHRQIVLQETKNCSQYCKFPKIVRFPSIIYVVCLLPVPSRKFENKLFQALMFNYLKSTYGVI